MMRGSRAICKQLRTLSKVSTTNMKAFNKFSTTFTVQASNVHTLISSARFAQTNSRNALSTTLRSLSVSVENLDSLGDSITTAVLLSWNKAPGDVVKEDDVIAVVETDKVTMDIRAKANGIFVEGIVAENAEIEVGSPLYKIDTSADATVAAASADAPEPAPTSAPANTAEPSAVKASPSTSSAPITVEVPIMGESITTGALSEWSVSLGTFVNADEVVAVIETDKVNVDVRTPVSGTITKRFAEVGDEIDVGNPLFVLEPSAVAASTTASAQPAATPAPAAAAAAAAAPVAPPAAPQVATPKSTTAPTAPVAAPSVAPTSGNRSETRVKMSRMRQRISQRLKEAQNTAAMLTTFQEVDMGPLIDLRNKHKEEFEKVHGVKLGFMSAFVRASTAALQEIPAVNAVIDDNTNEIVYRNYVDVSVAVASPNGLVVPVLRNTEKMSFSDVEKTIGNFGKKARDGALALEDMAGGTFTISNGGVFGSLFGTPIINPPQSAILGMHATKMRAVVVDGKVVARPMMYLALTYDHRMIDGREAVTFLKSVQAKIEDPHRLLLSM